MNLQDQIESFQKLVFAHFHGASNNECRISSLVPLVKESYGIYRFITSMMRAMHRSEPSLNPNYGQNIYLVIKDWTTWKF
jgi:huntingtin-interacting protein 1-related protein